MAAVRKTVICWRSKQAAAAVSPKGWPIHNPHEKRILRDESGKSHHFFAHQNLAGLAGMFEQKPSLHLCLPRSVLRVWLFFIQRTMGFGGLLVGIGIRTFPSGYVVKVQAGDKVQAG